MLDTSIIFFPPTEADEYADEYNCAYCGALGDIDDSRSLKGELVCEPCASRYPHGKRETYAETYARIRCK